MNDKWKSQPWGIIGAVRDFATGPVTTEVFHGIVFVLALAFLLVCVRYLAVEIHEFRLRRYRSHAATALVVYWVGQGALSGWFWLNQHLLNRGVPTAWMDFYPFLTVAMIITSIGILMKIHVFSPAQWGHRSWIAAVVAAGAFTALFSLPDEALVELFVDIREWVTLRNLTAGIIALIVFLLVRAAVRRRRP